MLSRADLNSPETVERRRRSVAMLTTGQMALNREEAMLVLDQLLAYMAAAAPDDRR